LDTAKSILEQDVHDLVKRTDLEEETILDVIRILEEEFEE
jgi:N utilization substance protein A